MIYSVSGKVVHKEPNLAVVECGGVAFSCRTSSCTLSRIEVGNEARLYTFLYVREDILELFGFFEQSELHAFKMLISVSGVGPKAALSILSDLSPQGFALSVASGDSKTLTKSQGIGTKTAQRIILELKDKIDKQKSLSGGDYKAAVPLLAMGNRGEAVSALSVLGFNSAEALSALEGLPDDMKTPELIKNALKKLGAK